MLLERYGKVTMWKSKSSRLSYSMVGIPTLIINQKWEDDPVKAKSKEFCSPDRRPKQQKIPSFSTSTLVAVEFQHWLESTAGGGKAKSQAAQVCSRAMKFLRFCFEDNSDADGRLLPRIS